MLSNSQWITVYDASTNPDASSFTLYGLTATEQYTFVIYSVNFNGLSDASSTVDAYSCGIPDYFDAPTYITSTSTYIHISWTAPLYNGGCPITDYGIYMYDDNTMTTFTEVNPIVSYTRNDPYTLTFKCTTFSGSASLGDSFRFFVIAYNI
jgi:hypothetical protein